MMHPTSYFAILGKRDKLLPKTPVISKNHRGLGLDMYSFFVLWFYII